METCPCVPDRIGIWKCWFLRRRERVPGGKPLGAKERTNNKLNPHMASTQGLEPGPRWVFFIGILRGNLFGEKSSPPPLPKLEGVEWRVNC